MAKQRERCPCGCGMRIWGGRKGVMLLYNTIGTSDRLARVAIDRAREAGDVPAADLAQSEHLLKQGPVMQAHLVDYLHGRDHQTTTVEQYMAGVVETPRREVLMDFAQRRVTWAIRLAAATGMTEAEIDAFTNRFR